MSRLGIDRAIIVMLIRYILRGETLKYKMVVMDDF